MGSDFDSFDQSALGAMIESPLHARGGGVLNPSLLVYGPDNEFIGGFEFTVDTAADTLSLVWHSKPLFAEGDVVRVNDLTAPPYEGYFLPAPLAAGTDYYVRNQDSTGTFQLSATPGGPIIDITSSGSSTYGVGQNPKKARYGLAIYDPDLETWTPVHTSTLGSITVQHLTHADGVFWLYETFSGNRLFYYDATAADWVEVTLPSSVNVASISEYNGKLLLLGTNTATSPVRAYAAWWDGSSWNDVSPPPFGSGFSSDIRVGRGDGNRIVAAGFVHTDLGLFVYDGTTWHQRRELPPFTVFTATESADALLWGNAAYFCGQFYGHPSNVILWNYVADTLWYVGAPPGHDPSTDSNYYGPRPSSTVSYPDSMAVAGGALYISGSFSDWDTWNSATSSVDSTPVSGLCVLAADGEHASSLDGSYDRSYQPGMKGWLVPLGGTLNVYDTTLYRLGPSSPVTGQPNLWQWSGSAWSRNGIFPGVDQIRHLAEGN